MPNFGEKTMEYSAKQGKEIPVWQSPRYQQSKKKALETIGKYKCLNEGDFWILMNETKSGKMQYTGLIISHNACLKINDELPEDRRFAPDCVSVNENGYKSSLVYTYVNPAQGIYEVGEVSASNCKNEYPYAMAFKRCFDRVVLKCSKLAYDGIYSDSEADEFTRTDAGNDAPSEPKYVEEALAERVMKGLAFVAGDKVEAQRELLKEMTGKTDVYKLTQPQAYQLVLDLRELAKEGQSCE